MRVALFVSVAANLLLVTSIVLARVDLTRREPERDVADGRPGSASFWQAPVSTAGRDSPASGDGSLDGYYRALRLRGLSHEETFLPVAGRALSALLAARRQTPPYWRSWTGRNDGAAGETALARLEETLRASLVDLYGDVAIDRPEFASLFYPLGSAFAFLNSEQQIAVARWQRSRRTEAARPGAVGGPASGAPCRDEGIEARAAAGGRRPGAPRGVRIPEPPGLDPGLAFEYALRTSPLAARLRPLDLDEKTFREAFRQLEALAGAASLHDHLDSRAALRRILGPRLFATLFSQLDPSYRAIADVLESAGIAEPLIESVYAVSLDAEAAMLSTLAERPAGASLAARVAEQREIEHARLASLVGEELASEIQALRAQPAAANLERAGRCTVP